MAGKRCPPPACCWRTERSGLRQGAPGYSVAVVWCASPARRFVSTGKPGCANGTNAAGEHWTRCCSKSPGTARTNIRLPGLPPSAPPSAIPSNSTRPPAHVRAQWPRIDRTDKWRRRVTVHPRRRRRRADTASGCLRTECASRYRARRNRRPSRRSLPARWPTPPALVAHAGAAEAPSRPPA